jgi:histidyl-tRNA synthetase
MSKLSTQPYKGVRDFYPDDMAIQRYIFDVWSQTAESFGYERYDASVLEPAELYKAKGAENEEMVNEQTYTFTDRGDREVTLRPEMTPTVARMIAAKRRELAFPVRWYSIPNLFRYERSQRGRLREHWQLNCDIFGSDHVAADIEMIALAYQIFLNFGADPDMFSIKINNRAETEALYAQLGITDDEEQRAITRLNDRKNKISEAEYQKELEAITDKAAEVASAITKPMGYTVLPKDAVTAQVVQGLQALGIENVTVDRTLARGFDYYTGTIFEFFDTDPENNRSLLGGGRYDNLTALFGGEPVSGVGFGFGDVTMRDFLETHNLLTADISAPDLLVMPTDDSLNLEAQKVAAELRASGLSVAVDLGTKKLTKKLSAASERLVTYALVLGEDEVTSSHYTVKNLQDGTETSGSLRELANTIS